jgi:hypothetical protein
MPPYRPLSPATAALALLCSGLAATPARAAASPLAQRYYSLALQGDLSQAGELFAKAASLSEEEAELRDRFVARFGTGEEDAVPTTPDPLVAELIATYQDYWRRSLVGELTTEVGENEIEHAVGELLKRHEIDGAEGESALARARAEVERRGFHMLGGRTLPLMDLLIWQHEDVERYAVELTDSTQPVEVVFLSGFLARGWADYATFGKAHTGGWAGDDRLYCRKSDYDVGSESFRVSYLAHEARHFADYSSFPALDSIELEYRAKLTELAFAESSLLELLESFSSRAEPRSRAPHPFANYAVIRDLRARVASSEVTTPVDWASVDPATIRTLSRQILDENTAALERAGATTTRGVIAAQAQAE